MTITNDIKYVGVNDHDVDLFEGQYDVPNGMAYNSYVILDDKIAVMDTVEEGFGDEWLANIAAVLSCYIPYGAGSLCKHKEFFRGIPGCNSCWQCEDIYDDQPVFWRRYYSKQADSI